MSQLITRKPGRRIATPQGFRKVKVAMTLVIYRTAAEDPNDPNAVWEVVPPKDVPDWVKEYDVVRRLANGDVAQKEHLDKHWYRAERLQEAH